ncbi:hypothetical protein ACMX2H_02460 [Arthrobacter sulfonylureivorans]|uniref:hypothetical protein n=1 Tax=Arthrobacter sulfonylureivorans TaxID=2486855 RepID=UPI0039E25121
MTDRAAADVPRQHEERQELRQEALSTALYVAICLLAALIALPNAAADRLPLLGVVWGVTIGLALAHWFAFRVSARLFGAGKIRQHDLEFGAVQLAGAAAVAVLGSIPALLLPQFLAARGVALTLAALIAAVGFFVARGGGATRFRSTCYAGIILVIALGVAELKNLLAGH